jgi:hypothetical protein
MPQTIRFQLPLTIEAGIPPAPQRQSKRIARSLFTRSQSPWLIDRKKGRDDNVPVATPETNSSALIIDLAQNLLEAGWRGVSSNIVVLFRHLLIPQLQGTAGIEASYITHMVILDVPVIFHDSTETRLFAVAIQLGGSACRPHYLPQLVVFVIEVFGEVPKYCLSM